MIQHRGKLFPTSNQRRAYSFQQMWKLYATILNWDWNELNIGFKLFTNHPFGLLQWNEVIFAKDSVMKSLNL